MYTTKLGVFLLIALALLYQNCEAARTILVRVDKSNLHVVEGDVVSFQCSSTATEIPAPKSIEIYYLKNAKPVFLTASNRIIINTTTQGLTMAKKVTFNPVEVSDALGHPGWYCKSESPQTFVEMFVLPLKTVAKVSLVKSGGSKAGATTSLECKASTDVSPSVTNPTLSAEWKFSKVAPKTGGEDVTSDATTNAVNTGSTRTITSTLNKIVSSASAGYYTCIIKLNTNQQSVQYTYTKSDLIGLPVERAKGVKAAQVVTFHAKTQGKLTCDVIAFPDVTVAWSKDQKPITAATDARYKFSNGNNDKNGILTISSVEKSDKGVYACSAKNPGGEANIQFTVTIKVSVALASGVAAKQTIDIKQKGSAKMVCKVVANPNATVTWVKGKSPITNTSNARYKFSDDGGNKNAVLEISSAQYSDRGVYTCTASNAGGSAQVKFTLRVRDPLGALWPFIGIVIEAILLAIIIIAYEKYTANRKKKGHKDTKTGTNQTGHDVITVTELTLTSPRATANDDTDANKQNDVAKEKDQSVILTISHSENEASCDTETYDTAEQDLETGNKLTEESGTERLDTGPDNEIFDDIEPNDTKGNAEELPSKETFRDNSNDKSNDYEDTRDTKL
eukprot:gene10011-11034_t